MPQHLYKGEKNKDTSDDTFDDTSDDASDDNGGNINSDKNDNLIVLGFLRIFVIHVFIKGL